MTGTGPLISRNTTDPIEKVPPSPVRHCLLSYIAQLRLRKFIPSVAVLNSTHPTRWSTLGDNHFDLALLGRRLQEVLHALRMAQGEYQFGRVHVLHGLSRNILRRRLQFVLQLLQVVQQGRSESFQWFRVVPSRFVFARLRDQFVQ